MRRASVYLIFLSPLILMWVMMLKFSFYSEWSLGSDNGLFFSLTDGQANFAYSAYPEHSTIRKGLFPHSLPTYNLQSYRQLSNRIVNCTPPGPVEVMLSETRLPRIRSATSNFVAINLPMWLLVTTAVLILFSFEKWRSTNS